MYITGAALINSLNTKSRMSYFNKGACGYIAAAIMLLWHDVYIDNKFIDTNPFGESYTTYYGGYRGFNGDPNNYYDGRTFSYNLWRWHSPNGQEAYESGDYSSVSSTIQATVTSYLISKNITYSAQTYLLPATFEIKSRLSTLDRPYILFGALKPVGVDDKSLHAITSYGYSDDGLICHFGWEGYTCNYVSGIWGGGYMITG